jgi:hypothetical protein
VGLGAQIDSWCLKLDCLNYLYQGCYNQILVSGKEVRLAKVLLKNLLVSVGFQTLNTQVKLFDLLTVLKLTPFGLNLRWSAPV